MDNFSVVIDWKFVVALGGAVALIIFASKMPEDAVESAFNHLVDAASKSLAIPTDGNR